MTPNIYAEVPINPKDASRRGIDPSVCKLIVKFNETEKQGFIALAEIIYKSCPADNHIFMTSVSEFVPLDKAVKNISEKSPKLLGTNIVEVDNIDEISGLLASWKAEALVVFFASESVANGIVSNLTSLEPHWWMLSKTNYELPFLKQLASCDPFIFFSQSHMSLEILGSQNQIERLRILANTF